MGTGIDFKNNENSLSLEYRIPENDIEVSVVVAGTLGSSLSTFRLTLEHSKELLNWLTISLPSDQNAPLPPDKYTRVLGDRLLQWDADRALWDVYHDSVLVDSFGTIEAFKRSLENQ